MRGLVDMGQAPAAALARAALTWPQAPPADETVAARLAREQLPPLYLHYTAAPPRTEG